MAVDVKTRQNLFSRRQLEYERFGYRIAYDSNSSRLAVGSDLSHSAPGALDMYLLDRAHGPTHSFFVGEAHLTPRDTDFGSFYGDSVAMHGRVLVVGAIAGQTADRESGGVYIYTATK